MWLDCAKYGPFGGSCYLWVHCSVTCSSQHCLAESATSFRPTMSLHRLRLHHCRCQFLPGTRRRPLPGLRGMYHLPFVFWWRHLVEPSLSADEPGRSGRSIGLGSSHSDRRTLRLLQFNLQPRRMQQKDSRKYLPTSDINRK